MNDPLQSYFRSIDDAPVPAAVAQGDFRRAAIRRSRGPFAGFAVGFLIATLLAYLPGTPDLPAAQDAARGLAQLQALREEARSARWNES